MYIVVGLGNPGVDYANTRHNVGFRVIDELAERNEIPLTKTRFKAVYGQGFIGSKKVMLVKPVTFMNNSGISVRDIVNFYKIPLEKLLVVLDDVDIDFADVRIRTKGSAGSHNGLKSIIYHLFDENFPRVRIGIGKKNQYEALSSFVLSKFSEEEGPYMDEAISRAAQAVELIIEKDIDRAMNSFNIRTKRAQD